MEDLKSKELGITKGPWAWQLFGDTPMLTAQHGMREIIIGAIKHPEIGYPIPAMNNQKTGRLEDIDKDHPNAKLIAAAPDLLWALQVIVSDHRNKLNITDRAVAQAAIQKATS